MKINIQIEIINGGSKTNSFLTSVDITNDTKISDLKLLCRNTLGGIEFFQIHQETITKNREELEDSELVSKKSGLKYSISLIDNSHQSMNNNSFALGRSYSLDKRDKNYSLSKLVKSRPRPPLRLTSRFWDADRWWGNQGNTPQCVGFAWSHWIDDGPVVHRPPFPSVNPTLIYTEAQKIDEWPGENYAGTSVRAGAKYLKSQNRISAYYWGYDLTTLINAVLNVGPVVVGTNWYQGMYFPNRTTGVISVTGRLVGGHAYLINGVNTNTRLFRIKNSWGRSWGIGGHAFISFSDMTRLIREYSEICLATEIPS